MLLISLVSVNMGFLCIGLIINLLFIRLIFILLLIFRLSVCINVVGICIVGEFF